MDGSNGRYSRRPKGRDLIRPGFSGKFQFFGFKELSPGVTAKFSLRRQSPGAFQAIKHHILYKVYGHFDFPIV